jgi:hypothetical protein
MSFMSLWLASRVKVGEIHHVPVAAETAKKSH